MEKVVLYIEKGKNYMYVHNKKRNMYSFFFKKENFDKTVLALLMGAATSLFVSDLQVNLLNPIINNIIMYEENPKTSSQVLWIQLLRSFIVLCIYILFIGITTMLITFNKKYILTIIKKTT